MESTKGDNMGNKENINEATELDKALEELGEELDVAEQEEAEKELDEVVEDEAAEAEVAEEEAEVAEAEEELDVPTLANVMDTLNDLRAMVEELKMQLAPVEPFTDEAEDLDVDIELADEEEDELDEDVAETEDIKAEDLDELDEDDFEKHDRRRDNQATNTITSQKT